MRLREFEDHSIHNRPHRLHQVEHQSLLAAILPMIVPDMRVEPSSQHGNSNLTLQDRVTYVQHPVYRVGRVPVRSALRRNPRANVAPFLGDRPSPLPPQRDRPLCPKVHLRYPPLDPVQGVRGLRRLFSHLSK